MIAALLHRFFRRREHRHWVDVIDVAYTVIEGEANCMSAVKYRCALCGREFTQLTDLAIEQLGAGYPLGEVVKWWDE